MYTSSESGSIVVGGTMTNVITLSEFQALGITTASNVTASTLTFLVSLDGTTFYDLYDETSTEVSITTSASANRAYRLNVPSLLGWNKFKIREGTSASPVAQQTNNVVFNVVTAKL
jgi:hypothetical protein